MLFAAPPPVQDQTLPPAGPDTQFREFPVLPEGPPMEQDRYIDIDTLVNETETGRFMFGVGVNSDAGLVGNDRGRRAELRHLPLAAQLGKTSATAPPSAAPDSASASKRARHAGAALRGQLSGAVPVRHADQLRHQRLVLRPPVTRDWDEERIGGGVGLGYQFDARPVGHASVRGEQREDLTTRATPTPAELAEVGGQERSLYGFACQLTHDTRDSPFLADRRAL